MEPSVRAVYKSGSFTMAPRARFRKIADFFILRNFSSVIRFSVYPFSGAWTERISERERSSSRLTCSYSVLDVYKRQYQVFLQEMRFLSLLYWLERFYVPIGITKLLSLWSCFSFLLMSLYYHLLSYLSILFRVFFVLFLFYFGTSRCISVFFTNYCNYSEYLFI